MTDHPPAGAEETADAAVPIEATGIDGDVSELERALSARGEPYVRATVVRREPPVSANVGDRALVTAAGELHGWIGGAACARSIVTREAREVVETGTPRLVGIAPDPETIDRPGLAAFPMTCHSEGVLEVFLEPVIPRPELVIVGDSPIAHALARLTRELRLDVTLVVSTADAARDVPPATRILEAVDPERIADAVGGSPLVVVASMGEYDAFGIAAGVLTESPYVGLVASGPRADAEIERAAELIGTDPESIRAAVTNPAGVDVAAHTVAEIAASLLAEVVDARATVGTAAASNGARADQTEAADASDLEEEAESNGAGSNDAESDDVESDGAGSDGAGSGERASSSVPAIDPVCGMAVDPADAAATVTHDGTTYSFCCEGCADAFENDPTAYVAENPEASG